MPKRPRLIGKNFSRLLRGLRCIAFIVVPIFARSRLARLGKLWQVLERSANCR